MIHKNNKNKLKLTYKTRNIQNGLIEIKFYLNGEFWSSKICIPEDKQKFIDCALIHVDNNIHRYKEFIKNE